MFNLFKSKKEDTELSLVKEVTKYPAVVEEIHNSFNIAGEKLLAEAKDIIASIRIDNEGKADALKNIGFSSTKEVVETDKARKIKQDKQELANALEYFSVHFPKYKFITQKMAMSICEKYNLVLGDVEQFTGFVPDKNIKQIQSFFEEESEINTTYSKRYESAWSDKSVISKHQYDKGIEKNEEYRKYSVSPHERFYKDRTSLKIAAPIKDMKKEGYKLKDRMFVKEIPDPVVLAPIKYKDIDLYCIITAWGDEASDPIVVNEINN